MGMRSKFGGEDGEQGGIPRFRHAPLTSLPPPSSSSMPISDIEIHLPLQKSNSSTTNNHSMITRSKSASSRPKVCRLNKIIYGLKQTPRSWSIVGALQYCTLIRPDICFAVNKVSQFMHKPLNSHWKVVKRILRYLFGTTDKGLIFPPSSYFSTFAFADANWGSHVDDRRSTSGYCVYFGENLVA
nr:uncharacterized protein LOC114925400 [Arachis hypogaea]